MEIHVDPLGGWSGDMFAAACLDAFPDLWPEVRATVERLRLGPAAACTLVMHQDGVLSGRRFLVEADRVEAPHAHRHHHDHDHAHDHDHPHDDHEAHHGAHRAWSDIRASLEAADLEPTIAGHAIAIFAHLAEAEAQVHGVPVDAVAFHEVGAVDSIVDIVTAAVLITRIAADRWTASALPLGGGRVRTAHGLLPVPAPATALLLRGLPTIDDGIGGERVTPTGAAIAKHLLRGEQSGTATPRTLRFVGTGFGTRVLPGLSNCLRVLAFDAVRPAPAPFAHRELAVIEFEVDDQSSEDLAHGLAHLRALEGIHDVIQSVVYGKKGRLAVHVQVLVAPECLEAAIAACFVETTTIGLRHHRVQGAVLPRRFDAVEIDGHTLRVKAVTRPDGTVTGKAEAADVAEQPGHAKRVALRRAGEADALARTRPGNAE